MGSSKSTDLVNFIFVTTSKEKTVNCDQEIIQVSWRKRDQDS